jgi:hypothetical protein
MNNTYRILSFDVGVINLAYCLIDINKDTSTFNIIDWNVINLVDHRIDCEHINNKATPCPKSAKYKISDDFANYANIKYCCESDKKHLVVTLPPVDIQYSIINSDDLRPCSLCKKKSPSLKYLYDNLIYCESHFLKLMKAKHYICSRSKCSNLISHSNKSIGFCKTHYQDSEFYKKILIPCKANNSTHITNLCKSMYSKFDSLPDLLTANIVMIENQPALKNPHMKAIASFIQGYFILRGLVDKTQCSHINDIILCSPSQKISISPTAANTVALASSSCVYKLTKQLSVKICKSIIPPAWVDILKTHKKQDDLADAFLQALVKAFSPLPPHYSNLITL